MEIERIEHLGKILAVIARNRDFGEGLIFPTPSDFPLQLGIHSRKKGTIISPHKHRPFPEVKELAVQEFLYVEKGRVKVELFSNQEKIKELVLNEKDMILLNSGHAVQFLDDAKIIEIKQGPYRGKKEEKEYISEEKEGKNDSSL